MNCIISILQYQRTQTTSGKCGSCWAFATVAVVESAIAIHNNQTPVSLSEQQLVDCDFKDSGCNGGYRPYAFELVNISFTLFGCIFQLVISYYAYKKRLFAILFYPI